MKNNILNLCPPIIWALCIYALSSIPSLTVEALGAWDYFFRKLWHLAEYGILSVLMARVGLKAGKSKRRVYLISLLVAFVYALTDEWHQTNVTGRFGSPVDVGIDTLGATVGLLIYRRFEKRVK